jgi:hypothetical protein
MTIKQQSCGLRILVADDDLDDLDLLTEACHNIAPQVNLISVRNGKAVFDPLDRMSACLITNSFAKSLFDTTKINYRL